MTEAREIYAMENSAERAILSTGTATLEDRLRHIKVQLLSLLVELDKALGDEPSVLTRAERRRRTNT